MTTQVDFPAAKRIAVWAGFQRGRDYQHPRFIVIDALHDGAGDAIQKLQSDNKAYHYYITEDGQIFQQVLEENTALTNAVGERPERFWFFAAQHGQVDKLSMHICLVMSAGVTREMLTTLAGLLADLHRRHRLELVPASNNGGVALRNSLDIACDMGDMTPERLQAVLAAAQGNATGLAHIPSYAERLAAEKQANEADEDEKGDEKDEGKEDEKPKKPGRPRKSDEKVSDE